MAGRLGHRPPYGIPTLLATAALVVSCGTSSGTAAAHRATAGRSSSPTAVSGTAGATIGALRITGAYIPQPASPDVAAAYLTVTNTGATPDILLGAKSSAAESVMAHDTVATGSGAEEMVPLGTSTIPPKGTLTFAVGHKHLMLMNPTRTLRQGDVVPLTLVFTHAGSVTLQVPVTSLTGPGGDGMPDSGSTMTGMAGMAGGSGS